MNYISNLKIAQVNHTEYISIYQGCLWYNVSKVDERLRLVRKREAHKHSAWVYSDAPALKKIHKHEQASCSHSYRTTYTNSTAIKEKQNPYTAGRSQAFQSEFWQFDSAHLLFVLQRKLTELAALDTYFATNKRKKFYAASGFMRITNKFWRLQLEAKK